MHFKQTNLKSSARKWKNYLLIIFLLLTLNILHAQDTIHSLIITEARLDFWSTAYLEITNMGSEAVQLSQFEIGNNRIYDSAPYKASPGNFFRLPDYLLPPGECYLICSFCDYTPKRFAQGLDIMERTGKPDLIEMADLVIHLLESAPPVEEDSVSQGEGTLRFMSDGTSCFYLEQHFENGDSVVVDQINGVFDGDNGLNSGANDVAGYENASVRATLIRRYVVKTGNLDFIRGNDEEESEWIVVPNQDGVWRKIFWTAGNHVNATLDENTLESDVVDVDYESKTLTVPFGTRRADDIMSYFVKKPGIAWNYICKFLTDDSLSLGAQSGDQLILFACGDKVERDTFNIIVEEPSAGANIVIPKTNLDTKGWWRSQLEAGILNWPRVTRHENSMDTIWGKRGGIPFATRTDSLLERLVKPAKATWKFNWVDNIERIDLKHGDIFVVLAEDGSEKDYFISVNDYSSGNNALLSSIIWPDIPDVELFEGSYGWKKDTIPLFNKSTFDYQIKLPDSISQIPALVAKTDDLNATVSVKGAVSLTGSKEQRTIRFTVTAENGIDSSVYNVEIIKEKDPDRVQPYYAEPFLSELVFKDQWSNSFGEICNPGNQPLDLSNYMIAMQMNDNPATVIESRMGEDEWLDRYDKYVPGYKWVNENDWKFKPGFLEEDVSVNPIVKPGDVFCFGEIRNWAIIGSYGLHKDPNFHWGVGGQLDVQFNTNWTWIKNPWNEAVAGDPIGKWSNSNWYMFKILNDSIKQGLKPANDPYDFQLIESFGMVDNSVWIIGGQNISKLGWNGMMIDFSRKSNIYKPNPVLQSSFGLGEEDCEWDIRDLWYWMERGIEEPYFALAVAYNIGQHSFIPPSQYMSTINSVVYKVSEGYSMEESIRGVVTGTTVNNFLENILKEDSGQVLKILEKESGMELVNDALLSINDTLIVLSADSTNTTKYILEVTKEGLNSDAHLRSNKYSVFEEDDNTGSVTGMEYGTTLNTILGNVSVPSEALLNIIDKNGAYVPIKQLNYNRQYIYTSVNPDIFLEVIAEDGVTKMTYQLIPEETVNDVFLFSDVYNVIQKDLLVEFVPRGTSVEKLLLNVYSTYGTIVKVIDKLGLERTEGQIVQDDRILLTSADSARVKVYYLSMLPDKFVKETKYLAYVTSNYYRVEQLEKKIIGATKETSLAEFFSRLTPAINAAMVLIDEEGNEKPAGNLEEGDRLKVTSYDGKVVVYYEVNLLTTYSGLMASRHIQVYPNPARDVIFVSGVDAGERIQLVDMLGKSILDYEVNKDIESISLNDITPGLYLMVVTNKHNLLKRFKVIIK